MRDRKSRHGQAERLGIAEVDRLAEKEVGQFRDDIARLMAEMERAVVGHELALRRAMLAVFGGGHALLEGVPGVGKTLLVRSLAAVLGLPFQRIQCTPDLIPADVTGTNILVESEGGARDIRFQPGPIFSMLVMADEINRATPKTQSGFLEAMGEGQVTTAGSTRALPQPFIVLATQNPIEMEGTFPLPEAQLDRFMFKIGMGYPSADELLRIARATTGERLARPAAVLTPERLIEMRQTARRVPISGEMLEAAVRIVQTTHPDQPLATLEVRRFVRYGASPRALQATILGAKVHALIEDRLHVAAADLAAAAAPALSHRLLLNFDASASEVTTDDIVAGVLDKVLS